MKQNRIFDQNSSQKARSWHYNMDTNRAEAQFADGSAIAIDCLAIEDEFPKNQHDTYHSCFE